MAGRVISASRLTRPAKEPVAWAALLAMFVWDLNDASGPKAVPSATLFIAVFAALLLLAVAVRHSTKITLPKAPLLLTLGCIFIGIVMIPFRPDFYLQYVANDLGTLALFLLCLVYAAMYLPELRSTRTVGWFTVAYVVIAFFAVFAAKVDLRPAYWWLDRWDPPYFMLFGSLALFSRYAEKGLYRAASLGVLGVMSSLALFSGNRTQLVLGLLFVGLAWASNRSALFLMGVALAGFLFLRSVGVIAFDPFADLFAESRFSLLEGGLDDSLVGRVREAQDIWYHLTVLNTPEQTLFGRGAGAVWTPITRYLADSTGEVFYLHTGPSHMTYRYGLLGLLLFVFWCWSSTRALGALFRESTTLADRFWIMGAFGFSLNFFLQNSLYDPPAVVAMATMLVIVNTASGSKRAPSIDAQVGPRGASSAAATPKLR